MGTKKGNRRKGAVRGARLAYDAVPKRRKKSSRRSSNGKRRGRQQSTIQKAERRMRRMIKRIGL